MKKHSLLDVWIEVILGIWIFFNIIAGLVVPLLMTQLYCGFTEYCYSQIYQLDYYFMWINFIIAIVITILNIRKNTTKKNVTDNR